jgi:DNA-binding transcriptional LysR family regulator
VDFLVPTHKLFFMVDLRRLRALRELADRGTIAAAADGLHLTPSAVSQQLSALEREVGQPLLEPDGRGVRLTPAAHVLLAHGDALFAQLELLQADLDAHRSGEAGEVRVGGFATSLTGLVLPATALLAERAPGVRVAVQEAESPQAFLALGRHELDVVLSMEAEGVPRVDDPRFFRRPLLADVLDIALIASHPLAGEDEVDLRALAEETWIAPPAGWTCEAVVLTGCRAAGFSPRIAHRTGDWRATLALVAAGFGVALVPRLADVEAPEGTVVRPLVGTPPMRHVFAACRRGAERAGALSAVLDALSDAAGSRCSATAATTSATPATSRSEGTWASTTTPTMVAVAGSSETSSA